MEKVISFGCLSPRACACTHTHGGRSCRWQPFLVTFMTDCAIRGCRCCFPRVEEHGLLDLVLSLATGPRSRGRTVDQVSQVLVNLYLCCMDCHKCVRQHLTPYCRSTTEVHSSEVAKSGVQSKSKGKGKRKWKRRKKEKGKKKGKKKKEGEEEGGGEGEGEGAGGASAGTGRGTGRGRGRRGQGLQD